MKIIVIFLKRHTKIKFFPKVFFYVTGSPVLSLPQTMFTCPTCCTQALTWQLALINWLVT